MGLSDKAISLNVPKGPCGEKIPGAGAKETQQLALDPKAGGRISALLMENRWFLSTFRSTSLRIQGTTSQRREGGIVREGRHEGAFSL